MTNWRPWVLSAYLLLGSAAIGYWAIQVMGPGPEVLRRDGVRAAAEGDYEAAIAAFTEVLRHDSADLACYVERGRAYSMLKRYDQAIADFTEALRQEPRYYWALLDRGDTYLTIGSNQAALVDFNLACRIAPNHPDPFYYRGLALFELGEYHRAIAEFSRAIALDPQEPIFHEERGLAHKRAKNYAQALADYQGALQIQADSATALIRLGWLQATCPDARFRHGQQALAHAARACELTQWQDYDGLDTLAAAHAEAGDFAQAVHWQEKSLALPNIAEEDRRESEKRLQLYKDMKPYREMPDD